MEKLMEALKNLLKPEEVNDVAKAVHAMVAEAEQQIRDEYEAKLHEAYDKFSSDIQNANAEGEKGYTQAYEVIMSLQKRLDEQAEEYENQMEEGFEEAFQELQAEKAKNENIEVELYAEFDKKLNEMRDIMVDKVDNFLALQEAEIYDEAKRDILNDPRLLEHKVALDRIVSIVAENLSDDDISVAASSKLEQAYKAIEDLRGQMRVIESKNVRLNMQNSQLSEAVRAAKTKVNESVTLERKERASKKENVSGRGRKVMREGEELIAEYANPAASRPAKAQPVNESADPFNDLLVLSGI